MEVSIYELTNEEHEGPSQKEHHQIKARLFLFQLFGPLHGLLFVLAAGAAHFINFVEEHFEVREGRHDHVASHEDEEEEEGEWKICYFDEPFVD